MNARWIMLAICSIGIYAEFPPRYASHAANQLPMRLSGTINPNGESSILWRGSFEDVITKHLISTVDPMHVIVDELLNNVCARRPHYLMPHHWTQKYPLRMIKPGEFPLMKLEFDNSHEIDDLRRPIHLNDVLFNHVCSYSAENEL